jgi:lipopolysaccharide transport system ATP-binding protein
MPGAIITAENISKKFIISHDVDARYRTIRDTISGYGKLLTRKTKKEPDETFWALQNISFSIEKGERVGIIGRNGAGKSTLLKILSRITPPTSGTMTLEGRMASLLEIGTGFHQELSGRENIFLNGAILGMSRAEVRSKFDEIVAFAEIEQFLDTPVKRYSSGMYVRLAFSVAAHLEPEILIVDEVLAVGDTAFQAKCLGKMEEVSKGQGRTILFVSHNLDAVRALCNRCMLLQSGQLLQDGPVQQIISRYLDNMERRLEVDFPAIKGKPAIVSVMLNRQQLDRGIFELVIGFSSPFPLNPPVPGFVIFNALQVPVLGSNPRYHHNGYPKISRKEGKIKVIINHLNLHTGLYKLDIWLGDHVENFDHKTEALVFEYQNPVSYTDKPDPLLIGSVDIPGKWEICE